MTIFPFSKDPERSAFLGEVVGLIETLGHKSIDEAIGMTKKYWEGVIDIRDEYIMSETPYYWAMCILHHPSIGDNQPKWYLDHRLMPPPEWIRRKYYNHRG